MILGLFYFFFLIATAITMWGIVTKKAEIVGLGAALFIVFGYLFMAGEPIDDALINRYTINEASDTLTLVDINYSVVTVNTDNSLSAFSNLFFYGGWAVLVLSVIYRLNQFITRRQNNEG